MHLRIFTYFALLSIVTGGGHAIGQDLPNFLRQLIEQYESASEMNSPGSIWRYNYKGAVVFYMPPFLCCDLPSQLYDEVGNVICAPDGGIAGVGDGACPNFFGKRTGGQRVWFDPRIEVPE